MKLVRAALLSAFAIALAAVSAGAQALTNGTLRQCLDAAPQSEMRRVAVFLRSDAADSAPNFLKPADLLVEILGERLRSSLGAKPGELPIGEPVYNRNNSNGVLVVTLYRDGRLDLTVRPDSGDRDSARVTGTRRLATVLRRAWDEGERVFWPDKLKDDSTQFTIRFWTSGPRRDGSVSNSQPGFAVAVFSLALPWQEPASADVFPLPYYPSTAKEKGIEATITLSFVVDTTGQAILSTVRDVLPFGAPVPVGEMAARYEEFVSAAKSVLPKSRFTPAQIAGCKVQQRVNLPFKFSLAGRQP
jgi:hypothetical protein